MPRVLNWFSGGLLLGAVFLLTVVLVQPIGVSTQFVIFDAVLWDVVDPAIVKEVPGAKSGYGSSNAYLNKSGGSYAKSAANPLNYSFVFVLAMAFGAFLSSILGGERPSARQRVVPDTWRANFGGSSLNRMIAVFLGGFIVLFGARLAGGCTSGHMMSGMMQTAVSGYLFALGAFAAAVPVAIFFFRNTRSN
ncbi:MAG: hypothetical protein RLZ98_856 [Pseudomonadota bacterium]